MTQVEIANIALTKLGEEPISDVLNTSNHAQIINRLWDTLEKQELMKADWVFAKKRASLALIAEDNGVYEYQLPNDCLKIDDENYEFSIEGQSFFSTINPYKLKYISSSTLITKWPEDFVMMFAARLSYEMVIPLSADKTHLQILSQEYEGYKRQAKINNGRKYARKDNATDGWYGVRWNN